MLNLGALMEQQAKAAPASVIPAAAPKPAAPAQSIGATVPLAEPGAPVARPLQ